MRQPLLRHVCQRCGIDLLDPQLQLQQSQQITSGVRLVDLLHQPGLARALFEIGFPVGMQLAGEFSIDLSHRLAGARRSLLALHLLRLGLCTFLAFVPGLWLRRRPGHPGVHLLTDEPSQLFGCARRRIGAEFDTECVAREGPHEFEVVLLLVLEAHGVVLVVQPHQFRLLDFGQQVRQLADQEIRHLDLLALGQHLPVHGLVQQHDQRDAFLA